MEICLPEHSDSAWALRIQNGRKVFVKLKKRRESLREFILGVEQHVLKTQEVRNGTRN